MLVSERGRFLSEGVGEKVKKRKIKLYCAYFVIFTWC